MHLYSEADFERAIFKGEADFIKSKFENGSFLLKHNFSKTHFSVKQDFWEKLFFACLFRKDQILWGAIFLKGWNFLWYNIFGKGLFSLVLFFKGNSLFQKMNSHIVGYSSPNYDADFAYLNIDSQTLIRFRDILVANFEFKGSDLRHFEFHNVIWNRKWGRDIDDEYLLKSNVKKVSVEDYAQVEELYRYLKLNYEKG